MEKKEQDSGLKWKLLAGILLLAISVGIYLIKEGVKEPDEVVIETDPLTMVQETEVPAEPVFLFVDVGGAVYLPGVLELPEGSRVYEAVEAAGGLTEEADIRNVNLAAQLHDGEKIYIPTEEEAEQLSLGGNSSVMTKVNINTANSADLQTLRGVGPATAETIIQYRTENGPFEKPEDLMNVSGIGQKTFDKLKEYIRVS